MGLVVQRACGFHCDLAVYSWPAMPVTIKSCVTVLCCSPVTELAMNLIAMFPKDTSLIRMLCTLPNSMLPRALRTLPAGKLLGCLGSSAEEQRCSTGSGPV